MNALREVAGVRYGPVLYWGDDGANRFPSCLGKIRDRPLAVLFGYGSVHYFV
jgi:hypothetical protein